MEGRFLSRPAKRPFEMSDSIPFSASATNGNSKRRPPPPIVISANDAVFRLLCPVSKIGVIIGKSGSAVNLIRQLTGAKVRVEDPIAASSERAVLVVGPISPSGKFTLKNKKTELSSSRCGDGDGKGQDEEEEVLVSPAQDALIRVFERFLEVDAEVEAVAATLVSCRLLVAGGQVGSVMGKGGKVIEKIRKDCRAKIKVLGGEQLPSFALPNDEIIQIMGDALAVKKALIAVSQRLQENPLSDKPFVRSKTVETGRHGSFTDSHESFTDPRGDHFSHRSSFPSPTLGSSLDYVTRAHSLATPSEKISTLDPKKMQQEVSFRLLCSNVKVGGVIGRGGTIVKALESETGASISVGASVAESEERVITISALESPESRHSTAQDAVARVFARSVKAGIETGLDSGLGKGVLVSARLLVPSNQIGCLMGKGGRIIGEMRKATGTGIQIIGGNQVPKCASDSDEVVQITGEFGNVQDALFHATSRLRDNILPWKNMSDTGAGIYTSFPESASYGRVTEPNSPGPYSSLRLSHNLDHPTTLAHSMDLLGLSHNIEHPSSPRLWASQAASDRTPRNIADVGRGLSSSRGWTEHGSGSKSAIVTNTTMDIVVPKHLFGVVYGENGKNLSRIRQISGAKVIVHDPQPGMSEGMVVISGTPDQTQAAQCLLQAFIPSARSSLDSHSLYL